LLALLLGLLLLLQLQLLLALLLGLVLLQRQLLLALLLGLLLLQLQLLLALLLGLLLLQLQLLLALLLGLLLLQPQLLLTLLLGLLLLQLLQAQGLELLRRQRLRREARGNSCSRNDRNQGGGGRCSHHTHATIPRLTAPIRRSRRDSRVTFAGGAPRGGRRAVRP
jgi:hypothetical protein